MFENFLQTVDKPVPLIFGLLMGYIVAQAYGRKVVWRVVCAFAGFSLGILIPAGGYTTEGTVCIYATTCCLVGLTNRHQSDDDFPWIGLTVVSAIVAILSGVLWGRA